LLLPYSVLRFEWQAVALLPFIDADRLLAEIAKVEHTLTVEEAHRNTTKGNMMFLRTSHPLAPFAFALHDRVAGLTIQECAAKQGEPGTMIMTIMIS
jgi:5'-3' exoribonuclease 2